MRAVLPARRSDSEGGPNLECLSYARAASTDVETRLSMNGPKGLLKIRIYPEKAELREFS